MEILPSPSSMNEFLLRKLTNKLVTFGIVQDVSIVERHGLCAVRSKVFPNAIIQNTNCRKNQTSVGHWVCMFSNKRNNVVYNMFYDSFGKDYRKYDITLPVKCHTVNFIQHQPDDSNLCALYCLFFITSSAVDKNFDKTLHRLFNTKILKHNDKLMLEFYNILYYCTNTKTFLHNFVLLKKLWCKKCALIMCTCRRKSKCLHPAKS